MPDTVEAVVIFVVAIAPGYLLIRGYTTQRAQSTPERDLYVLAQAIVASTAWVALLYLAQHAVGSGFGHSWLKEWGLLPLDRDLLRGHQVQAALALLFIVFVPYFAGALVGRCVAWMSKQAAFKDWKVFAPPSAWDHTWDRVARLAEEDQWVDVVVRTKTGAVVRGRYANDSEVDLFPRVNRDLLLKSGYSVIREGGQDVVDAEGARAIFISGDQIEAIFLPAKGDQ